MAAASREVEPERRHRASLRSQKLAFGAIRALSVLTLVVLAAILGFILWKGLRYSNLKRSAYLPVEETAPEGLAVVVNPDQKVKNLEWATVYGIFTDEYLDWSKLDGTGLDLVPVAVSPSTPAGSKAESLLFDSPEEGGVPLWGALVRTEASAKAALAAVASTPGAVAIVPSDEANSRGDVRVVPLRRVVLAVHPAVMEFVNDDQIRPLTQVESDRVAKGGVSRWSRFGGPDIPVVSLAPPAGSELARVLAKSGVSYAGVPAPDMASYISALSGTEGAAGYLFARDADATGLGALVRTWRESGWNLTLDYLTEAPGLSGRVGGISTIILNTVFMLALTVLFAAPIGIAAAVYLVEYVRQGVLLRILRLGTETLAGIPSIIFGLFGFIFFVSTLRFGFGLLSGCLTLTLMILPTIIRTAEEALKSVPRNLREGSLALGATKLQTIARVVIPAAAPGILTGVILAVGRAVGETAALIFTMGSDYKLAQGLFSSARSLSTHVYLLFAEGVSFDRAFSTATVLVAVVLGFNFAARALLRRMGGAGRL